MATKKTTKKRKVLRKATGKMKTPRVGGRFGALAAAGALGYSLYSKMAGKGSDKTPQKAMSFEEAKRAGVGPIRPKRKVVRKAKVQTIRPKRAG